MISHPELQHSHQLGLALHEAGLLGVYLHGACLAKDVRDAIPQTRRRFIGWYRPLRSTVTHLLPGRQLVALHTMLRLYDWEISRRLEGLGCNAVVAYENSALATFQEAKRLGMICILDAASFHHRFQTAVLPQSNTPDIKARKDQEIEMADLVITCSPMAGDSYIAAGVQSDMVRVVPLGVDVSRFQPRDAEREGPRCGPIRFCYVGQLAHHKGVDLFADACRHLRSRNLDFRLSVAGSAGGKTFDLVSRLRGIAEIAGFVSHSRLVEFYRAADILVLPSRFDSFGMVVTEALACGLPVIVSNNVGSKDVVREGVNGWVIPAGDANALAKRMIWCATNPEAVRAMGHAARESAEARSWVVYRREVVDTIRGFLDEEMS